MQTCKRIGIPLEKVGERLKQLNEAIKANNMVIKADNKIEIDYSRNETALAVTMTVYLFDEEEDKENEQKAGE